MPADYYRILEVDRDATTEEIKRAFRQVARATHPDANPGDPAAEAKFREAAEAYEVLSDPERRRRYDRGDTIDLGDIFGGFGGLDDLLRSVFGDGGIFGGQPSRPNRGRDVLVRVGIDLTEAASGTDSTVSFKTRSTCDVCDGTGAETDSDQVTCSECNGVGQVRAARRSLFGTMMTVVTCPTCHGEGVIIASRCGSCGGNGWQDDEEAVSVEIPAGITSGTRLRLSGRGESGGRRGPPGDLFVEVRVEPDARFVREEADLFHGIGLGLAEATLGTQVEIPLIEGEVSWLEIPPGTQPGTVFTIPGEGMPVLGRRLRGDLHVQVSIDVPDQLSAEEVELLQRFAELRGERTNRPASAG